MDGLNHGVITGKCSGCVAYREEIARLKADLEVARAETRELAEKGYEAAVWGWSKERNRICDALHEAEANKAALAAALDYLKLYRSGLHGLSGRQQVDAVGVQEALDHGFGLAALSDTQTGTAGEGWLRGLPFSVLVSAWVKAQPEMMAGIREGVKAMKEGRVTPWEDVERELWPGKGWPEVREQMRQGLHEIWSISAYPSPFYKKVKGIIGQLIRDLDALEVE